MSSATSRMGTKMAAGAAWLILLRMAERGIGLISTLILVRLLLPEDFGLVAMAMSLVAMVDALGYFGLDAALIQNRNVTRDHFDTVWTITVIYGIASCLVLALSAAAVSKFYVEPRLEAIIYALASFAFLQSLENVGMVSFQKEMRFNKEFQFKLVKKIVGFFTTVSLALYLGSYWALIVGVGITRAVGVALSYYMISFRPRFSLGCFKELWRFSIWMWLNNAVVFSATRGYDFIIGRIGGARALGLYSVAYEVASLPTTEVVDPISRAILPGFANMSGDPLSLTRAVIQSASIVALITVPLGAGLSVLSEPFVRLVLGEKWTMAIPLIQVLALYGVMRAAHAGTGPAYISLGYPRIITFINMPHLIVGWPMMIMLLPTLGVTGAGYAIISASMVGLSVNFYFARKLMKISFLQIMNYYWRPIAASLIMVLAEKAILRWWPPAVGSYELLMQLLFYVVVGGGVFLVSLLSIWGAVGRPAGAEQILIEWLKARRHSDRPAV
jgi:lipopolysaccharide exporter